MDRKTYRTQKFGSWEYSQQLDAKTVEATKADGIEFHYDSIQVTPNTFDAHRLTWFAGQKGKGSEMAEYLLSAYFTKGENIGNLETLANLAEAIGINDAKAFLQSDRGIQEVKELKEQAIAQGIHGVPHILIGQEIVSGAQTVEMFLTALQNAINQM